MAAKIKGLKQLGKNISKIIGDVERQEPDLEFAAGLLVQGEAQRLIAEKSQGELVTRYRAGGGEYQHTASKEGDAPNTDTGRLMRSIRTVREDNAVRVGTNLKYAPYLEFGTVKIGERPFLRPALENKMDQIIKLIGKGVRVAINRSSESSL